MFLLGVEPVLPSWKVGVVTASPPSRTLDAGLFLTKFPQSFRILLIFFAVKLSFFFVFN